MRDENKTLNVLDLQNELERRTAVPVKEQRLYFKAQELHMTPFKTLKDIGLVTNNLVKLVGEPSKVRYSNIFGRLNPPAPVKEPNTDPSLHQFFKNIDFQQNSAAAYNPSFNTAGMNNTNGYMNNQSPNVNQIAGFNHNPGTFPNSANYRNNLNNNFAPMGYPNANSNPNLNASVNQY